MKTVGSIVLLIVFGVAAKWLSIFVLNLAGLPGALIAFASGRLRIIRFIIGLVISTIGQSYVYLAFVAFVVNWTKRATHNPDVSGAFLWPVAFLACFVPVYLCGDAIAEAAEPNVQVEAIFITELLTFVGFFVFAFFPNVITLGWPWIPYLSR